jgi:hypothetical protein
MAFETGQQIAYHTSLNRIKKQWSCSERAKSLRDISYRAGGSPYPLPTPMLILLVLIMAAISFFEFKHNGSFNLPFRNIPVFSEKPVLFFFRYQCESVLLVETDSPVGGFPSAH